MSADAQAWGARRDRRIRHRASAALRQIGRPAVAAGAALPPLRNGAGGLLRMLAPRALAATQPPPAGNA